MNELGIRLRELRDSLGLKLRAVEEETGVSNAYLSQLETGKTDKPSPAVLKKLAALYGTSFDSLMILAGQGPRDVFISHRSSDKDFVRELAADIESESYDGRNLSVWLDEAEIRPGQSIPKMLNDGLENSRFVAIVMTPDYFASKSGWTDAEWHAALGADPDNRLGKLIPLIAADCPYIPYLLLHLKCIDFRGDRYARGLRELLGVLKNEPLPRPVTHRGQLITSGGRVARATLIAERAVPDADPDAETEWLYCNLLPVERLPKYLYSAALRSDVMKEKAGKLVSPRKSRLKEIIRTSQEADEVPQDRRFMPAFRIFEDRVLTFHDPEDTESPLAYIVDDNDVETLNVSDFVRHDDLRKILISLLNMSIDRHLFGAGLVVDSVRQQRYFFPSKNGGPNEITWTPRKKKARRVVAKPIFRDSKLLFWRHFGAYLKVLVLVNKFYIQITPTWVLTGDGEHAQAGPDIGRHVIKWTGAERNLQILYHVRFWTYMLRRGRGGPISIRAGDQSIEVATVPAMIQQSWGISGDYENLWAQLDDNASSLAAEEEDLVDDAFEIEVEDIKSEEIDDVEEEATIDESDEAQ